MPLTEQDVTNLRHVALTAHANGYDGRDVESTQDRVIAAVERILAAHVEPYRAALGRVEALIRADRIYVPMADLRDALAPTPPSGEES